MPLDAIQHHKKFFIIAGQTIFERDNLFVNKKRNVDSEQVIGLLITIFFVLFNYFITSNNTLKYSI